MTKYKTTDAKLKSDNYIVIDTGYCNIRNITRFLNPKAYNHGVYGWRYDVYELAPFDCGIVLLDGYRGFNFIWESHLKEKNKKAFFDEVNKRLRALDKQLAKRLPRAYYNNPALLPKRLSRLIRKTLDKYINK